MGLQPDECLSHECSMTRRNNYSSQARLLGLRFRAEAAYAEIKR